MEPKKKMHRIFEEARYPQHLSNRYYIVPFLGCACPFSTLLNLHYMNKTFFYRKHKRKLLIWITTVYEQHLESWSHVIILCFFCKLVACVTYKEGLLQQQMRAAVICNPTRWYLYQRIVYMLLRQTALDHSGWSSCSGATESTGL